MPLYEYECASCGRRTEIIQRVGAPPIGPCSECGGAMKRLLSAPAFQFKGSGWYVTDYARRSSASAGPSAEGTSKGDTDGKPAAESAEKRDAASAEKRGAATASEGGGGESSK